MILSSLKRLLNKRSLKKQPKPIKRKPTNLEASKWIGILFDATSTDRKEAIERFAAQLEASGKYVKVLAFMNDREKEKKCTIPYFNRRNINWIGTPKGKAIEDFLTQSFDTLLVLHPHNNLTFEYISTLVDAKLKVGPITKDKHCLDLMMDVSKKMDIEAYIEGVVRYANIIRVAPVHLSVAA
jgi:hypothetical protein